MAIILSLMITTLLGSIILMAKWPYLPSDPRTVSGEMYYLLNSSFYEPDPDPRTTTSSASKSASNSNSESQGSPSLPSPQNEPTGLNTAAISKKLTGLGQLPEQERNKQIIDLNYNGELLPSNLNPKRDFPSTSDSASKQPQNYTTKLPTMGIYIEPAPGSEATPSQPSSRTSPQGSKRPAPGSLNTQQAG